MSDQYMPAPLLRRFVSHTLRSVVCAKTLSFEVDFQGFSGVQM